MKFLPRFLLAFTVGIVLVFSVALATDPSSVTKLVTKAEWALLSDQQRAHICNEYRLSPATAEAAFKRNGSPIVDESWTYLQPILAADCA